MENFSIITLNDSAYDRVVIATAYISPISTLDDVQSELKNVTGRILFDLSLINGTNSNRYIEAQIENGIFLRKTFSSVKSIDNYVESQCRDFFVEHKDLVKNGTITQALMSLLMSGEKI